MLYLAAALTCCTITGLVHGPGGTPLAKASITLRHDSSETTTHSEQHGNFLLHAPPGAYILIAGAQGYAIADVGPIDVRADTALDVLLEPADSQHLRPIGEVTANGSTLLSRSATPSVEITRSQFDQAGYDRIVTALPEVPSVTLPRPDGGSASAPAVLALRGPDPSETLITLDGQVLNDANTGDLDLSRLPVAGFSAVDITEGLGPTDLEGSNTIGGALNMVSLRPTQQPHSALSFRVGSFGGSEAWLNETGTDRRLGYAFAFESSQEAGYVNQDALICQTNPCVARSANLEHLGSGIASRSALAHLTWQFSPRSQFALRVFSLDNQRDESAAMNAPDPSDSVAGGFVGPGQIQVGQTIRAYDLRAFAPLGSGTLAAGFSASNNTLALQLAPVGISPYDISHHDKRQTVSLSWQRSFERFDYSFGGYVQNESLSETNVSAPQRQTVESLFFRSALRPTSKLRLGAAMYASNYSTFGGSVNGRLAISYDLTDSSVVRFSVGTGFRAPLLIERYVFSNAALPPPNVDCVIVGQGNPSERAEHATEYELGYAQRFGVDATFDISAYRTNLRDPIENFYPGNTCPQISYSYPINVGNVVYEGGAVRWLRRFKHLSLSAQYGLNVAYPYNLPATVANPTSGGFLVSSKQFLGIPQQVGSLQLSWTNGDWHAALDTQLRGKNNELNQGPYAIVSGAAGRHFGKADLTLALTNITNAVSGRFTALGGGVPYLGNGPAGLTLLPTNRLFIEPLGASLILTIRQ
ncbi:MAG: TonB-dependent receptor [Candidatus Eremiobacteraeota bacterium]|nr:TonB-dependent receptor [Candidatus Eremiobacteraeota bacterium]